MRVISGDRKGHRLTAPKGKDVRPTEDKVKESFFNIISPILQDSIVLDLFAGTGSIGIEFLSRGAAITYFVDKNFDSIKSLKINLEHTRYQERGKIIVSDARHALKRFNNEGLKFDYIYIDPPFAEHDLFHDILELLGELDLMSKNAIIVVEHDKKLQLLESYGNIFSFDNRSYGNKIMTYYKCKEVQR